MFDLVLLPLQLLLTFLIYRLQLYKPVLQMLFAQIMDHWLQVTGRLSIRSFYCTDGEEDMIILLVPILPLTK